MPNSTTRAKEELLSVTGAATIAELFSAIPADHRMSWPLDLPPALRSEVELQRHLVDLLRKNTSTEDALSFLGAGCWPHHVPAVCDEIASRTEFLTPILGTASSDHGRNQAWFEFSSQLAELVDLDFVGLPTYSWGCSAGHAIRMASRLTGRTEVLIPRSIDPERLSVIRNYCEPPEMPSHIDVILVDYDPTTGEIDLVDLADKLSERTAAVYVENPTFFGTIESAGAEIASRARSVGAETIVGVDPISLGVLLPPGAYGADIVVGTIQPLGMHMNCGGGTAGFIATRDDERYAREYPTMIVSIAPTTVPGERGFANILVEQTSYGMRDQGKDWTGTSTYLWAVVAATYMSLMGPAGFEEIGELILQRSHYAARRLAGIAGVGVRFSSPFFKEMVVDLNATGLTVAEINARLRTHGIFGGKDLSHDHPELGQSALYCVTEVHTQADIDRLIDALSKEITV